MKRIWHGSRTRPVNEHTQPYFNAYAPRRPSPRGNWERGAGDAVLPVGRVRGAYGGAEAPPFRLTMATQICLTKH